MTRRRACLCLLAGLLCPAAVPAAPRLRCQIDQGGDTRVIEVAPVSDPYRVKATDIGESFRFKAVVIGDERQVEYIKLYTYYRSARQPVLLHQASYSAPVAQAAPSGAALTGHNRVYGPGLGRELQYGCALFELAP
ncbi:MAG TPA: hypothetical protein VIO81_12460 [Methyloversatilis sp.]